MFFFLQKNKKIAYLQDNTTTLKTNKNSGCKQLENLHEGNNNNVVVNVGAIGLRVLTGDQ